jgi:RNA polymerase sigma-70 factor (ECF subfamily)
LDNLESLSSRPSEAIAAKDDDHILVEAVLRKDRKATADFVDLHADAIYAYVRRRLVPRMDLVDDLVQEVFLAAWESLAEFRGTSSLRAWLLGIARHKVEDYYRSRLRDPDPLDDAGESAGLPSPELRIDEQIDFGRLRQKANRILEDLPEQYALVLLWRYWEKRSAHEMALLTGRTEKAVERLLARARKQFKRRWHDE